MSIYGAMFSGVSALNAQSQALSMISDNISNVNTVGYKGTHARFSTLVTKSSTAENYSAGGVRSRPHQGVDVQGLLQSSSSPTDLAISGDGFFVVNESAVAGLGSEYAYTRAGSFKPDADGYLRNTAGFYLQGWPTDGAGTPLAANTSVLSALETVNVNGIGGTASATGVINIGANLPATATAGDSEDIFVRVYDSLGVSHDVNMQFTKTSDIALTSGINLAGNLDTTAGPHAMNVTAIDRLGNSHIVTATMTYSGSGDVWNVAFTSADGTASLGASTIDLAAANQTIAATMDWSTPSTVADSDITLDFSGLTQVGAGGHTGAATATATTIGGWQLDVTTADGTVTGGSTIVTFNGDGTLASPDALSLSIDWTTPTTATDSAITIDLGTIDEATGLTQFSGNYAVNYVNQDGVQFGTFSGLSVGEDGVVRALFDNGESRAIYKLPVVTFPNPNGLTARTGNVYIETDRSGTHLLNAADSGAAGKIAASALEASTVDIAEEFTNMIITQRAYSAATKIITTADEMLDDLIRSKR